MSDFEIVGFILSVFSGGAALWVICKTLSPDQPGIISCFACSFIVELIILFKIPFVAPLVGLIFLIKFGGFRGISAFISGSLYAVVRVIFIIIFSYIISLLNVNFTESKASVIEQNVKEIKYNFKTFPYKISNTIILEDVTAEPSAIRFHYEVLNPEGISQNFNSDYYKRKSLVNDCITMKYLFDQGISLEFVYTNSMKETVYAIITPQDCANIN